ncbi:MAG: hypothetical protein IJE53_06545 [Bacilli bacterium]|nr:hypothetical protein [Bacilli bacterium]
MTSLLDYDILTNEVFYRCWHILDYIAAHPDMPPLERESIEATIMEALVSKKLIDPTKQSLDLKNLVIVDDTEHYRYEEHPRICGIPLWMKDKFRKKSVYIAGSVPISLRLSRPPVKFGRSCVYDPNYAVSSIFEDATFIEAIYDSPTRPGVRLEETRPFVEVKIDGVDYLVDVLTKRILRSDWFKEEFNMDIKHSTTVSTADEEDKRRYYNSIAESNQLASLAAMLEPLIDKTSPIMAEYRYEFEKTKENFPEEWEKAELFKQEMAKEEGIDLSFLGKMFRKTKDE